MKEIFYPGSFDPFTLGHLNILERAVKLFDHVRLGILKNPSKQALFSLEERRDMLQKLMQELSLTKSVSVEVFDGLAVNYMKENQLTAMLRGIRLISDFEMEMTLALNNKSLYPGMETVFLFTDPIYCYISSSSVKEIYSLGGDIKNQVPEVIYKELSSRTSK